MVTQANECCNFDHNANTNEKTCVEYMQQSIIEEFLGDSDRGDDVRFQSFHSNKRRCFGGVVIHKHCQRHIPKLARTQRSDLHKIMPRDLPPTVTLQQTHQTRQCTQC